MHPGQSLDYSKQEFNSLRKIPFSELNLNDSCVGKGAFGRCYSGFISAHIKVCVKVFRGTNKHDSVFALEAVLTSQLCHPNLPWLYGVVEHGMKKMLLLSFHDINGESLTLQKALQHDYKKIEFDITLIDWKTILIGMVAALKYLHDRGILHNDIKSDNIVIDNKCGAYQSIMIDLGKGCYTQYGKMYKLSKQQRLKYATDHPQIAPDLRDGLCKQCELSDVYSLGRVIQKVNNQFLKISTLTSYSSICIQYSCTKRPSSSDLYVCISNLCKQTKPSN